MICSSVERIDLRRPVRFDERLPATVRWKEPGRVLLVAVGGSGTPGCVPEPLGAGFDGERVTVTFAPVEPGLMCTMDFRIHAWQLTWPVPFGVTDDLPMTLQDATGRGSQHLATLPLEPGIP